MKKFSFEIDNAILEKTDYITGKMQISRSRYINEALCMFNAYNKRQILKEQLEKESLLTSTNSLEILKEFETCPDQSSD
jgi:predicted transcriptional regulator